jgi:hypothetical protein
MAILPGKLAVRTVRARRVGVMATVDACFSGAGKASGSALSNNCCSTRWVNSYSAVRDNTNTFAIQVAMPQGRCCRGKLMMVVMNKMSASPKWGSFGAKL